MYDVVFILFSYNTWIKFFHKLTFLPSLLFIILLYRIAESYHCIFIAIYCISILYLTFSSNFIHFYLPNILFRINFTSSPTFWSCILTLSFPYIFVYFLSISSLHPCSIITRYLTFIFPPITPCLTSFSILTPYHYPSSFYPLTKILLYFYLTSCSIFT